MTENKIKFHNPHHLSTSELNLDYNQFADELSNAQYALGVVQGSQRKLQNPSLLVSPLAAKEATVSSRIEGTQSTVSDVFLYEASGKSSNADTLQVFNYRQAIYNAMSQLQRGRPLTPHLLKSLHTTLLTGVRHKGKLGEFRQDKVWIAEREGDPIEKALYIPPEHFLVNDYVQDLFEYINNGKENVLVKTGLAHYQFEAVHPFDDGNGRIGRLFIPLILCQKNTLSHPIVYISGYFDSHRDQYIAALHEADQTGKYEKWLKFYLHSIEEQLKETQKLIDSVYALHDKIKKIIGATKSPFILPFLDFLFEYPVFTLPKAQSSIKASSRITLISLVNLFKNRDLISETEFRNHRAKIYSFDPLIQLL
jgi:Fic family protein